MMTSIFSSDIDSEHAFPYRQSYNSSRESYMQTVTFFRESPWASSTWANQLIDDMSLTAGMHSKVFLFSMAYLTERRKNLCNNSLVVHKELKSKGHLVRL